MKCGFGEVRGREGPWVSREGRLESLSLDVEQWRFLFLYYVLRIREFWDRLMRLVLRSVMQGDGHLGYCKESGCSRTMFPLSHYCRGNAFNPSILTSQLYCYYLPQPPNLSSVTIRSASFLIALACKGISTTALRFSVSNTSLLSAEKNNTYILPSRSRKIKQQGRKKRARDR